MRRGRRPAGGALRAPLPVPALGALGTIRRVGLVALSALAACGGGADHAADDELNNDTVADADPIAGNDDGRGSFGGLAGTARAGEPDEATPASGPLPVDTSWTWQLLGDVDTSVDAVVYDIDLFDVPDETLAELRADGRMIVCYFSAGSYEDWRPDAGDFDEADLGAPLDGWEGERWLDIRSNGVLAIMEDRLDLAAERGCDGVEPDNVDGYTNDSGFDLTAGDQLAFDRAIADAARERGLLVGLKNDLDQVADLVDAFDFAVNEQCHEFDECELLDPFVAAGKPAFNAEYAQPYVDDRIDVCIAARERGLRTLVLPLDLDGSFRISCDAPDPPEER